MLVLYVGKYTDLSGFKKGISEGSENTTCWDLPTRTWETTLDRKSWGHEINISMLGNLIGTSSRTFFLRKKIIYIFYVYSFRSFPLRLPICSKLHIIWF